MGEILDKMFRLFLVDVRYIQAFVFENFGRDQFLINKNRQKILASNYSIENSRIKGYGFHGYGCLFQFKDFYIDIDFRFDKVGFNAESLYKYLGQKGMVIGNENVQEFLELQGDLKKINLEGEGIYTVSG